MEINWEVISLCIYIFTARAIGVTLGTARIVFISKGKKFLPVIIGFVEALIWITIVSQIVSNLTDYIYFIAYAAGFSLGNYTGMLIIEKFTENYMIIRIITGQKVDELIAVLQGLGVGTTRVDGEGLEGKVSIIYTIVHKGCDRLVLDAIKTINKKAFYSVESISAVNKGIFPGRAIPALSTYDEILRKTRMLK